MYKKFGVLGLRLSGIATVEFLLKKNLDFIAWDDLSESRRKCQALLEDSKIAATALTDDTQQWEDIDCLILTPGIPLYFPKPHPLVEIARKSGIKIICDIELFYLYYPDNTYIGVTGTNGKSTTCDLIYHTLKSSNINAKMCGNIGIPILSVTPSPDEIMIIEISSFQLDLIDQLKFDIAILLNITPDHLDRHGSMENYIKAKSNIFKNQTGQDVAILSDDNELTKNIALKLKQRTNKSNVISFSTKTEAPSDVTITAQQIHYGGKHITLPYNKRLKGSHNAENIVAAYMAISKLGLLSDAQIANAISSYRGLKHRMEFIGEHNNIEFINDSKATNAESAEKALLSFENIYWIIGGLSKEGGIEMLYPLFHKIKHAFIIGAAAQEFSETLNKYKTPYTVAVSLDKAFELAVAMAEKDHGTNEKTLLLSPACASYDQWKNFEERGKFFTDLVEKYMQNK